jgi:uncharacterized protein (TIGR03437 family)
MKTAGMLFVCLVLHAQDPYVNYRGVVNAASFAPPGISGSEIARGSMFSIFGSNMGPVTLSQVSSFPLSTTLAGVSIKVTQGNISVDAFPVVVTASQINAIMPSNAPLGRVSIRVTYNGGTGNPTSAIVAASGFGIFAVNSGGFGPGILQNYIAADNQPINSLAATAAPGQVITLWGTGLGPVPADNVAPTPGSLPTQVEIFVGGKLATNLYSGRTPCCSAIDQIVFQVPNDAPLGCYVPVQIRTAGTTLSNAVTMAIESGGAPCSDPNNPLSSAFEKGGKLGVAVLARSVGYDAINSSPPQDVTEDLAALTLRVAPGGPFFFNPAVSAPPIGSCTMYTNSGRQSVFSIPDLFGGLGAQFAAGPSITVTGAASASIPNSAMTPLYAAAIGSNDPLFGASALTISDSGTTSVSAVGGAGVGPFQVNVPVPAALDWTNRPQGGTVNRSQPFNVTWNPAGLGSSLMIIAGTNYDLPTNVQRTFSCTASASAGSFTIPAYILSALPATRAEAGKSSSTLMVGLFPAQSVVPFSATGLDSGLAVEVLSNATTVTFQ